jgi:molybdenum cofactor synthesis domain-containing protein
MTACARAAVVTVGTELIAGDVSNDNASWLARSLGELGIAVSVIVALPDDVEQVAGVVRWAHLEHDLVVVTGGLGVTPDDVTREAIARALRMPCVRNESLHAELRAESDHRAAFADRWAGLPQGARPLPRLPEGAPAFAIENVYVLSGSPEEMRATFEGMMPELPVGPPSSIWRRTYEGSEDAALQALSLVSQRWPEIEVCSYPAREGHNWRTEIVLRGRSRDRVSRAAREVEIAMRPEAPAAA